MYVLTATIDRFEKGKAVLRLDDGQEIVLAKRQLPDKVETGSVIIFELFRAEAETLRRQNVARYLLQEILEPHEPNHR